MRSIVHWDGDRFFASIEQAADRRLRNRPVAVGGEQRGIVVSASAEARRFGVRPGMAMRRAKRACPRLIVIPGHFELYEQFSSQIIQLCEESTPLVEPVAVGAAYLDLTGTREVNGGSPKEVIGRLRQTVHDWLRVSLSAGIGANKTVARIGARLSKPAGQRMIAPGGEAEFLAPLAVSWIVDPSAAATLELAGVRTLGELVKAPSDALALALGKRALGWQRRAQGVDEDPVRPRDKLAALWRESFEFAEDEWREERLLAALKSLLEPLLTRLRAANLEARKLSLGLRYTDHDESSASVTMPRPTDLDVDFLPRLSGLLRDAWKRRVRLRRITLSLSRVYPRSAQMSLFGEPRRDSGAMRKLAVTLDELRRKYGDKAPRFVGTQE